MELIFFTVSFSAKTLNHPEITPQPPWTHRDTTVQSPWNHREATLKPLWVNHQNIAVYKGKTTQRVMKLNFFAVSFSAKALTTILKERLVDRKLGQSAYYSKGFFVAPILNFRIRYTITSGFSITFFLFFHYPINIYIDLLVCK